MYTVHLGFSGFPLLNSAAIQRIRLTFKALKTAGANPVIINKTSINKTKNKRRAGRSDGIIYINMSCNPSRPDSFIYRSFNKLSGFFFELLWIIKKRNVIDSAIFYGDSFWELLYYRFLSRLFNFKLAVQYVEFRSSFVKRQKSNDFLFDNYCFFFCDGLIVISNFLKERSQLKNKSLPLIKVPAITDFNEFPAGHLSDDGPYLLYCGSITYLPVIDFVIDLFERLRDASIYDGQLMLIIGGRNMESFQSLEAKIKKCKFGFDITLRRNISRTDLLAAYKGADLLLIPLRNNLQDIARFPQKISEYAASSNAILSTNIGDVSDYFTNGDSAILASEYSVESYFHAASKYLRDKSARKKIGENGYQVGLRSFNYLAYSRRLRQFLSNL